MLFSLLSWKTFILIARNIFPLHERKSAAHVFPIASSRNVLALTNLGSSPYTEHIWHNFIPRKFFLIYFCDYFNYQGNVDAQQCCS